MVTLGRGGGLAGGFDSSPARSHVFVRWCCWSRAAACGGDRGGGETDCGGGVCGAPGRTPSGVPDSSWRCGDLTIDPIDRNAARLLELSARFRIGAPAAFSETTRAAAADGGAGGGDTGAVAAAAAAAAASAASPQAGFFHVVRFVMRLPQNVRPLPGSVRCTQFLAMSSLKPW